MVPHQISLRNVSSSFFPSVDVLSTYPQLSARAVAAVSWQDSILRHNHCTWGSRWLLFQCEFQGPKKYILSRSEKSQSLLKWETENQPACHKRTACQISCLEEGIPRCKPWLCVAHISDMNINAGWAAILSLVGLINTANQWTVILRPRY